MTSRVHNSTTWVLLKILLIWAKCYIFLLKYLGLQYLDNTYSPQHVTAYVTTSLQSRVYHPIQMFVIAIRNNKHYWAFALIRPTVTHLITFGIHAASNHIKPHPESEYQQTSTVYGHHCSCKGWKMCVRILGEWWGRAKGHETGVVLAEPVMDTTIHTYLWSWALTRCEPYLMVSAAVNQSTSHSLTPWW